MDPLLTLTTLHVGARSLAQSLPSATRCRFRAAHGVQIWGRQTSARRSCTGGSTPRMDDDPAYTSLHPHWLIPPRPGRIGQRAHLSVRSGSSLSNPSRLGTCSAGRKPCSGTPAIRRSPFWHSATCPSTTQGGLAPYRILQCLAQLCSWAVRCRAQDPIVAAGTNRSTPSASVLDRTGARSACDGKLPM